MQGLGQRAVLEVQAWAVGALAVAADGDFVLDCRGVGRALLYAAPDPRCGAEIHISPYLPVSRTQDAE